MKKILIICAGILLSGCGSFWNPFGTDNLPPPSPLAKFAPERTVLSQWSTKVGVGAGESYIKLSPAHRNNKIFTADVAGRVTAVNASNGITHWKADTQLPLTSGVASRDNLVVIGANDGQVIALSADNGRTLWRARVPNQVLATPAILDSAIMIKTVDGQLCSLNRQTGLQQWCQEHGAPSMMLRGSSAPQYADGVIIVGYADGVVVAYHADTGKQRWERIVAVPKTTSIVSQLVDIDVDPRISNGVVYVATYQGHLAALSLRTGEIIWEHPLSSYSGLALGQDYLFVSDANSTVYAFDRLSGDRVWQQKGLANRFITGPVLVDNQVLVVGDKLGYLHWLSQRDGRFLARTEIDKKHGIIAEPLAEGNTVYVNTVDGRLNAYRLK